MTQRHGDQDRHNIFSGNIDAYACVQMPIAGRRKAVPARTRGQTSDGCDTVAGGASALVGNKAELMRKLRDEPSRI